MTDEQLLWVVEVDDERDPRLAGGRASLRYHSPPQPLSQALELVAVLLGGPESAPDAQDGPWRVAIAGGRRDVRLHRARADGQLLLGDGTRPSPQGQARA